MEKAENFYWKLFKSTFIISAFTVGGGFVIIPLLKAKYVDEYKWIKEKLLAFSIFTLIVSRCRCKGEI